jgi:hypothetical protein
MIYKILDPSEVAALAAAAIRGEKVDFSAHEVEAGAGVQYKESALSSIAGKLRHLKRKTDKQRKDRENFDSEAFEILHSNLPFDVDALSDGRFWTRFALVYLLDVITWRFPGRGSKGFNTENLGLGTSARKQAENYLYKLWVRGEIATSSGGKDPYKLGRAGSIDFWTSHIHRQGFASCRTVAGELLRFQYPPELKGKPKLLPGEEDVAHGRIGVRTLVKRLRRTWATVELSLLDAKQASALLKDLSHGLTDSNGKPIRP